MTATIIPFPVNPRSARADIFRPEWTACEKPIPVFFNTPLRHDGVPLHEGDRVLVRHPQTGEKREGIILSRGIKGVSPEQQTMLVLYMDGARHLTRTVFVECARAHELNQSASGYMA